MKGEVMWRGTRIHPILTISLLLLTTQSVSAAGIVDTRPPVILGSSIDDMGQDWIFRLLYDRTPNFLAKDEFGRPADSFQWYLTDDPIARPMSSAADFIVRGDEMAQGGATVCATRPSGAGCPGGWGLNMGMYHTSWDSQSNVLSLTIKSDLFGGRILAYDVISMIYGVQLDAFTGHIDGKAGIRFGPVGSTVIGVDPWIDPKDDSGQVSTGPPPVTISEAGSWILTVVGLSAIWFGIRVRQEA